MNRRSFLKRAMTLSLMSVVSPTQTARSLFAPNHITHYNYISNPLTTIAMMKARRTHDPVFGWFTSSGMKRNNIQIFRTPLAFGNRKQHLLEIELALMFGHRSSYLTGGRPEHTTGGIIEAARVYGKSYTSDYSRKNWTRHGKDWLYSSLEEIYRCGSCNKLAFVGDLAMSEVAKLSGIKLRQNEVIPKIKSHELLMPYGTINLIIHPLFNFLLEYQDCMIVFDPSEIKYRYINSSLPIQDELLSECGLEYDIPESLTILNGIGG